MQVGLHNLHKSDLVLGGTVPGVNIQVTNYVSGKCQEYDIDILKEEKKKKNKK